MSYEADIDQIFDRAWYSTRNGLAPQFVHDIVNRARDADAEIAKLLARLADAERALQQHKTLWDTDRARKVAEERAGELETRLAGAMGVVEAALAFKKHEQEINHHDFKEHVLRRLELLDALYGAALASMPQEKAAETGNIDRGGV